MSRNVCHIFLVKVSFFHVRSPDEVSFGACINAYSKGSRWRDALGLLDRMPELSIVPNTVNLGGFVEVKTLFQNFRGVGFWTYITSGLG